MEPFSPQFFLLTLALVGVVIIVAALLSGFIDRSDIPQVGVFLALGAMLGPAGLQLLNVSLDSPILRVVATLSLVLVLFTDAVSLSIAEIRRHRLLAFLVIGPGTLLSAALIALAAWILLDFSPASAVVFAAYAAGEAVHGSGFLAAFCAGLTIAALDVELCDCFLEYGQTTAEMTLLFTFILFGSSLIWQGLLVLDVMTVLFAVTVVLIRPIVFLLSLSRTNLERRSCFLIAWFGPRGLSSLLLILVPVFAGVPGSEQLFIVCCLVVLLSVALHGGSLMLLARTPPPPASLSAAQIDTATPKANDGEPRPI